MTRPQAPSSLKIFDRGYQVVNYGYSYPQGGRHCPDPKAPSCIKGRDDGKISPEEIWDAALLEKKYRPALQKILGRPISWALEDGNAQDIFDLEQKRLALTAIHRIETLLQERGVKPGSAAFQERMAVALCFLVAIPEPKKLEAHHAELLELLKPLDAMDLGEWKKYLLEHGGMGPSEEKDEEWLEFSALEALKIKKGQCTELSKILYAVLELAELRPIFVNVNLWRTDIEKVRVKLNQNPAYGHACVAVFIGDKTLLLDPALVRFQPVHEEYYLLSLRHFLSLEQINYAQFWEVKGDEEKTANHLQMALSIDPANPIAHVARGLYRAKRALYPEAMSDFNRSLRLHPFYAVALMLRGQLHGEKQDWSSALADLDRSIALQPNIAHSFYQRGLIWFRRMDWPKARSDFSKAIQIKEEAIYFKFRGQAIANQDQWEAALEDFQKSTELNPSDKENNYLLAVALLQTEKHREALPYLDAYILQAPADPEGFDKRGVAWGLSGQWEKALADFNEAFRLSTDLNPNHLQHRAIAWLQLGNFKKCRQDFAALLKLLPEEEKRLPRGIAGTFEHQLKQSQAVTDFKNALSAETGLEISMAKGQALMSGVYWDIGKKDKAVEIFEVIFQAGWKVKPSPRAKKFFQGLFQYLPDEMRRDPAIQKWWKRVSTFQSIPNSLSLR
jgi:tetratricopeptide (TPR) repeat protein